MNYASPSSLPSISKCAFFQSGGGSSEAAERGDLQHKHLAYLLRGLDPKNLFMLDEDEKEAVRWAAEQIMIRKPADKLEVERKIKLLDESFNTISSGRADAISGNAIFDYKSGEKSDYRLQMADYALMLMNRDNLPYADMYILYGKTRYVEKMRFTKEEASSLVLPIIAKAQNPSEKATPCEYCKWCSRIATCPPVVEAAFAVIKGREDCNLPTFHASRIEEPSEMAKALNMADYLEDWAKAVRHHGTVMILEKGVPVPGWTIKQRTGSREISDIQEAFKRLGIPQDKFLQCCDIRFTSSKTNKDKCGVENIFAEFNGCSQKAAKEQVNTKLAELIKQKPTTLYIAKEKTPHA